MLSMWARGVRRETQRTRPQPLLVLVARRWLNCFGLKQSKTAPVFPTTSSSSAKPANSTLSLTVVRT